ncbi:MAG: diaminopimelate decarboxylase [Candidatus Gracilibacteria bacterium]
MYEEKKLRSNCQIFRDSFRKYFPDFWPLYAIKANNNPELLKIIAQEGFDGDCSSESEAWICKKLGIKGMYTGNYTTKDEFEFVKDQDMILNLDDISMIDTVNTLGMPNTLSFRINPGIGKGFNKDNVFAGPDAKYGVPFEKAPEAYAKAKDFGVKHFGIHMMTGTNVPTQDIHYFSMIIAKLFDIIAEIKEKTGIEIEFMNMGGGFGVPYRPEEPSLDMDFIAKSIRETFDKKCSQHSLKEPRLIAEPGRWITANAGWLISKAHVIKNSYKKFVGIDASSNDMPRPAIYGAYHHVSVIKKLDTAEKETVSIAGRICENSDQLARDRELPKIDIGDIIVIHNCGGHAYAMGHNYNGTLRHAEYLIDPSGNFRKIRRAETIEDLYKTCEI